MKLTNLFLKPKLKKDIPDIRPGDIVGVHEKIKEGDKERIQVFTGVVLARKHGKEMGSTITVRRIMDGVGVEKTFPLHSPTVNKIEIRKRSKVRRAKLYYLREAKGKKARLKRKELKEGLGEEETIEEKIEELPEENIGETPEEDTKEEEKIEKAGDEIKEPEQNISREQEEIKNLKEEEKKE